MHGQTKQYVIQLNLYQQKLKPILPRSTSGENFFIAGSLSMEILRTEFRLSVVFLCQYLRDLIVKIIIVKNIICEVI